MLLVELCGFSNYAQRCCVWTVACVCPNHSKYKSTWKFRRNFQDEHRPSNGLYTVL